MHTTPSHVALDTTGTLNARNTLSRARAFQVVAPSIALRTLASSKAMNRVPFTFVTEDSTNGG